MTSCTSVDWNCVDAVGNQIATDLAAVLAQLTAAAGPNTPIVAMNYYNPYLASWLNDQAGQELAVDAAQAVAYLNGVLRTTYETAGIAVADVALAFESDDFSTMVSSWSSVALRSSAPGSSSSRTYPDR